MRRSLVCLLLLVALPAAAQIYKYTDANGNTAYTNQPPEGTKAQVVDLPPLPSINTVKPAPATPAAPAMTPMPPQTQYTELALTDLPDDEALRANNGSFTVGVKIRPKLDPGFMFQLLVDGKPYGQPTNVPRLQVINIDRGEHSLAVQVLDSQRVVQQSPTVTVTVQRVHVGKP